MVARYILMSKQTPKHMVLRKKYHYLKHKNKKQSIAKLTIVTASLEQTKPAHPAGMIHWGAQGGQACPGSSPRQQSSCVPRQSPSRCPRTG